MSKNNIKSNAGSEDLPAGQDALAPESVSTQSEQAHESEEKDQVTDATLSDLIPGNTSSVDILPTVVIAAYKGTADLVHALWDKFLPDGVKVVIVDDCPINSLMAGIIADADIPDLFVFVPANCVPMAEVDPADLEAIKVYVRKDGSRTFGERLPVRLDKSEIVNLLSSGEDIDTPDKFFGNYIQCNYPNVRPLEVSHSVGSYITLVLRESPCENVVIAGMLRSKYIATSEIGWRAIEVLLSKRLQ